MTRSGLMLIVMIMGVVATPFQSKKKPKPVPNRSPIIKSFTSSLQEMVRCDTPGLFLIGCTKLETLLKVDVSDPDSDRLTYKYEVTGGKVIGDGAEVIWNLENAKNGEFAVKVTVDDNKGAAASTNVSLTVRPGVCCEGEGICPTITVECPENSAVGRPFVFVVTVSGGPLGIERTYHWSVDRGSIVKGQGTSQIEVNPGEKVDDVLTATAVIGGYHPDCSVSASCWTKIQKPVEEIK